MKLSKQGWDVPHTAPAYCSSPSQIRTEEKTQNSPRDVSEFLMAPNFLYNRDISCAKLSLSLDAPASCSSLVLTNPLEFVALHLIQIQRQSWAFTVPLPFLPSGELVAILMFTTKRHQSCSPISISFSQRFVFRYLLSYQLSPPFSVHFCLVVWYAPLHVGLSISSLILQT